MADVRLDDYKDIPDAVVLPGGQPGADNLRKSQAVSELLSKMQKSDKWISAICASPARVLAPSGILNGKKATCYPGYEKELEAKASFSPERVVRDGKIITSRGPGTALEFSLELVRSLVDDKTAQTIREKTLAR